MNIASTQFANRVRNHDVGFFDDEPTRTSVEQLSQEKALTVFVGAGASVDHGLPSWASLVDRMLASFLKAKVGNEDKAKDLARVFRESNSETMVATVVDSFFARTGDPSKSITEEKERIRSLRNAEIRKLLYDDGAAVGTVLSSSVVASVVRLAVALKRKGVDVHIVTTNYDDMLEHATTMVEFERAFGTGVGQFEVCQVISSLDAVDLDQRLLPIAHVHGHIPRLGSIDNTRVVFSEQDYFDWETLSTIRMYLSSRFSDSAVLFVGVSLRDHNIMSQMVNAVGTKPRVAILPSQTERGAIFAHRSMEKVDRERRRLDANLLINLQASRGQILRTTILRPDFYGQVVQFLEELTSSAELGAGYQYYSERVRSWAGSWMDGVNSRMFFEPSIASLARLLAKEFENIGVVRHAKVEIWSRQGVDKRTMTRWISSQTSPATPTTWLHETEISQLSAHAAVRCFADRRSYMALAGEGIGRRWTHWFSVPIVLDEPPWGDLPVGALVVLANAPDNDSEKGLVAIRESFQARQACAVYLGKLALTPPISIADSDLNLVIDSKRGQIVWRAN